nr:hypothetical protein [[Ruminococcus] torques]
MGKLMILMSINSFLLVVFFLSVKGCAAVTLASYVLPKLEKGEWKRVLFVPTGALMSTVSFNEGASVPGIAHGIVLESDA